MKNQLYTAQDVVSKLKGFGFEYTVHGLRKQLEMGCVPSYTITPHKKKFFTETDYRYFLNTAVLRLLGFSLRDIKKVNQFDNSGLWRKAKLTGPDVEHVYNEGILDIIMQVEFNAWEKKAVIDIVLESMMGMATAYRNKLKLTKKEMNAIKRNAPDIYESIQKGDKIIRDADKMIKARRKKEKKK